MARMMAQREKRTLRVVCPRCRRVTDAVLERLRVARPGEAEHTASAAVCVICGAMCYSRTWVGEEASRLMEGGPIGAPGGFGAPEDDPEG
jgi:hypothetical protein